MSINIQLQNAEVGVGHANAPTGEKILGLRFIDPVSGISLEVTFVGDQQIDGFKGLLKRPGEIEIVQTLPAL